MENRWIKNKSDENFIALVLLCNVNAISLNLNYQFPNTPLPWLLRPWFCRGVRQGRYPSERNELRHPYGG